MGSAWFRTKLSLATHMLNETRLTTQARAFRFGMLSHASMARLPKQD